MSWRRFCGPLTEAFILFSSIAVMAVGTVHAENIVTSKVASVFNLGGAKKYEDPVTGMTFVYVQGGCYRMGSMKGDAEHRKNEEPTHQVCVNNFYMGIHEVSNAEYRKLKPEHISENGYGQILNGDEQPVVNVNWNDAVAFAKQLSRRTGKQYRLPTEAEWEYAARAGSNTQRYWGNDIEKGCKYANLHDRVSKEKNKFSWENVDCDDGYAVTAPVGSLKHNDFGLYDMLGNVWEWCSDWYGENYYDESPKNNPQGPESGVARVRRGASWSNQGKDVRVAVREMTKPVVGFDTLGFRLVLEPGGVN